MKTILLVCAGALSLWGQCGPGQVLAPIPGGLSCVNTSQVVISGGASASTVLPQANLVAAYPLTEGAGAYAYNYAYVPQPIYNMAGPSEQQFATNPPYIHAGATVTDSYSANPNGDFLASRIQMNAAAGGYIQATANVVFTTGQQYTLSIYALSNTGVAQAIRIADNNVVFSSNLTIPATGWARVSYTFTASGSGGNLIPVAQDATADALDISVWGMQLEIGPHPTTYVPQVYQMVNGGGPQASAHQCAWVAAGIDCTGHSGASYMSAVGWQPIDLATTTIYAAVKWTGTNVLAGYVPIIGDNYNTPHLYLTAQDSGVPFPRMRFGSMLAYAYGANLNDGSWHILAAEYDGANISIYLDGSQVSIYNVGSVNPIQFSQLYLGNFANAAYWPGQIGYVAVYSLAHSPANVAANTATIRTIMAQKGVTIPALPKKLVFEGDSITDPTTGVVGQSKYPAVAQAAMTPFPQGANDAVSGSSIASASARSATVDYWFTGIAGSKVLMLLLGANDQGEGSGPFVASVKAYCLARKAATPGLKIVLATVLPQTTANFNTFRNAVNTAFKADPSFYDVIADFAADPTMGCDACAANATYYPDGEHPSIAGHAILGPIAKTAIQTVW